MTEPGVQEPQTPPAARPVFLLGIRHRSGTNMLQDVLTKHPQCSAFFDPEDFLLSGLNHLENYTDAVQRRRRSRQFRVDVREALRTALGRSLAAYVTDNPAENQNDTAYVVAKTPSVESLPIFRRFFPDAHVILLVRDGRSILESAMRSFGADFEDGCRRFAAAVDSLNEFRRVDDNPDRTFFVRFEDYLANKRETIDALLEFLGLDKACYPYADIEDMPVRGSSELKSQGETSIHWGPVEVDETFDPRERFRDWTPAMHARFNWIAGTQLESLGYETTGAASWRSDSVNRFKDMTYLARPDKLIRKILRLTQGSAG